MPQAEGGTRAEIAICYTDSGKYVVHVMGVSALPGETTQHQATVAHTPGEMFDTLRFPAALARGQTISWLGKQALLAAVARLPELAPLLETHI